MNTKSLLFMIAAMSAMTPAMAYAQAESDTVTTDSEVPYIILADELGNLSVDADGNYNLIPMQKVMVGSVTHYAATNVDVSSGKFAVYAKDSDGNNETFYGLTTWAVTPLVCGDAYPNPIGIVDDAYRILELPVEGTYNFDFFDRVVVGKGYHQIAATKVDDTLYPQALYVISGSTVIEVPEISGAPGSYYTIASLPSSFQVCYEKRAYDLYSFGPEDAADAELQSGVECPIVHAANFSTKFTVAADARSSSGESDVYIDVAGDNMFIRVTLPGMSGVEPIESSDEQAVEYYTLSGTALGAERPTEAGIYLRHTACGTTKVAIR